MKLKNTEAQPEQSVLGLINQHFHQNYRELMARQRELIDSAQLNVLLRMDDRLSLFRGKDEIQFCVNGDAYHRYKAVSHIALATFLALEHRRDSAGQLESLFSQVDVQNDQDAEQVIDVCQKLMAAAGSDKLAYEAVKNFGKALASPMARLIDRAAKDEVQETMTVLEKIDAELSIDWSATYLVVCDGLQPRYKNLSKMLFKRWVESRNDQLMESSHHVIYSEACESYDDVAELLSRHLAGGVIGDVFLQNPLSLSQDVLGDAAQRAIDQYFLNQPVQSERSQ